MEFDIIAKASDVGVASPEEFKILIDAGPNTIEEVFKIAGYWKKKV